MSNRARRRENYWTPSSIYVRRDRCRRRGASLQPVLDAGARTARRGPARNRAPAARSASVLFELARRPVVERAELRGMLGIDDSFLSRLLRRLQRRGLVTHERSAHDGRRRIVHLTAAGRDAARLLDDRSAAQVDALVAPLDDSSRRILVEAMAEIEHLTTRSRAARVADRSAGVDRAAARAARPPSWRPRVDRRAQRCRLRRGIRVEPRLRGARGRDRRRLPAALPSRP